MAKGVTYFVTDSTGKTHTRYSAGHTAPVYTHAVVRVPGTDNKADISYASSAANAQRELGTSLKRSGKAACEQAAVFPVTHVAGRDSALGECALEAGHVQESHPTPPGMAEHLARRAAGQSEPTPVKPVKAKKFKIAPAASPAAEPAVAPATVFAAGDSVSALWDGKWWPATYLAAVRRRHRVRWENSDEDVVEQVRDRFVPPKSGKVKAAKPAVKAKRGK